jgi:plastocyanin
MTTATRLGRYLFREPSGHLDGDAVARALGGAFLIATAADHLDLYLTGYRFIPTIGWMFLVQFTVAFALGLALLGLVAARQTAGRRAFSFFSWQQVVSASGALLTLGTLCLYLAALGFGIFGYHEIRTSAGILAASLELATFVILGRVACAGLRPGTSAGAIRAILASAAVTLVLAAEVTAGFPAASSGQPTTNSLGKTLNAGVVQMDARTVTIVIKNFAFSPADPVVRPGEEIIVKNEDPVAHTFSSVPGVPRADAFTSGTVLPGHSVMVEAPEQPGRYPYACLIHSFMTGTLIVSTPG